MVFKKKKDKKKDKKGPKGKVARAKAKLERQWGEYADEELIEKNKIRHGKSRLLKNVSLKEGKNSKDPKSFTKSIDEFVDEERNKNDRFSSSDDDSDDSDDSGDDDEFTNGENKAAFGNLMKRIKLANPRGTKRQYEIETENSKKKDFSSNHNRNLGLEVDDHLENKIDVEDSSHSDSSVEDDENNSVVSENSIDQDEENSSNENPFFTSHFSTQAFSSDEAASTFIQNSRTTNEIVNTQYLNSSIELNILGSSIDLFPKYTNEDEMQQNLQSHTSNKCYKHLCKALKTNWKSFNADASSRNIDSSKQIKLRSKHRFSTLQASIFPAISSYTDILCTAENRENNEDLHNIMVLHILNHIIISQNRIQKHDRRIREILRKEEIQAKEDEALMEKQSSNKKKKRRKLATTESIPQPTLPKETQAQWRDQGYVRPKVLILLPTRGTCHTLIKRMMNLLGKGTIIENQDRFNIEFGPMESKNNDIDIDDAEIRRRKVLQSKGKEWNELFGENINQDDEFKIGVSLSSNTRKSTKKTGQKNSLLMKLYSDFYQSDIIFASPLGLKMTIESKEDNDCDFLSSIEICMVTHSDVLLMQNWEHLISVLDFINLQPKSLNTTDFSRVRYPLLEGQGAYWRQLIFLSNMSNADIAYTFKHHSKSIAGQLKIRRMVPLKEASICDVLVKVKQIFQRIPCHSVASQDDDRLKYFAKKILPQILRMNQKHTLIYIPSYFDFVAIRNLLTKNDASFVSVTEYARVSEVSRGRARFHQGRKNIMLYTGRAHFFQRHQIKGITHLVFYGLPEHADFYPDLIHMVKDSRSNDALSDDQNQIESPASCLVLYTKYNAHEMERIVGTENCARMIQGTKNTYLFC